MIRHIVALAGTVALTACGPLVQIGGNDKAPTALLTLRASAAPVPIPAAIDKTATVLVLIPTVPGPLQTLRLPVTTGDTQLAYLTGATWAEQPNRQFQHVLADTIAARGVVVLDPKQAPLAQGRTLSGELVEFGLDVRNPGAVVVRVRYDATLAGSSSTAPLAVRRFDTSIAVSSQLPGDVAVALNEAANTVAGDVAAWIAR